MSRIAMLVVALSLLVAAGAAAQISDLGGTVVHVDPMARTITFDNGRIAHYDPLWRILVNGRPVALAEAVPGPVVGVTPGAPARVAVPGAPQPAMAPGAPAVTVTRPVDAAPVAPVQRVETQTMILPDGRALKVTEVRMWRGRPALVVERGTYAEVGIPVTVVSDARTTTVVTPPAPAMTARVKTVEPRGTVLVFPDGQTVLLPAQTVHAVPSSTVPAQTVTILKPGDEVTVQVQEVVPMASRYERMSGATHDVAVARGDRLFPSHAVILDDQVVLLRYPQAL